MASVSNPANAFLSPVVGLFRTIGNILSESGIDPIEALNGVDPENEAEKTPRLTDEQKNRINDIGKMRMRSFLEDQPDVDIEFWDEGLTISETDGSRSFALAGNLTLEGHTGQVLVTFAVGEIFEQIDSFLDGLDGDTMPCGCPTN